MRPPTEHRPPRRRRSGWSRPTGTYSQWSAPDQHRRVHFRTAFDSNAAKVDFADWARLFAEAGARYVVLVSRHLDGFPLWPTSVANPHMPPECRSNRDLVGDLTEAVRVQRLRMGLYYAGGLDWTFTDSPIRTMTDLTCRSRSAPCRRPVVAGQGGDAGYRRGRAVIQRCRRCPR